MPVFDVRCEKCDEVTEVSKAFDALVPCPVCAHPVTKTLMPQMCGVSWRDNSNPFDDVDKGMSLPDPKKIKSFANDRRKGGK